jgi:hypothetical protein
MSQWSDEIMRGEVMARKRDRQRSKVYRSDDALVPWSYKPGTKAYDVLSLEEIQSEIVRPVLENPLLYRWMRQLQGSYPYAYELPAPVRLDDGRGTRVARAGTDSMNLPRWARTRGTVLHELAHVVQHRSWNICVIESHGPEFCATYLIVVELHLGFEAREALAQEFIRNRVQFRVAHKEDRAAAKHR